MDRSPVIFPSLLEDIVIGPVTPQFNICMDNWIEPSPIPTVLQTQPHPSSVPPSAAASSQPHPQTSHSTPPLPQPPPKKQRFSALTKNLIIVELAKPFCAKKYKKFNEMGTRQLLSLG